MLGRKEGHLKARTPHPEQVNCLPAPFEDLVAEAALAQGMHGFGDLLFEVAGHSQACLLFGHRPDDGHDCECEEELLAYAMGMGCSTNYACEHPNCRVGKLLLERLRAYCHGAELAAVPQAPSAVSSWRFES